MSFARASRNLNLTATGASLVDSEVGQFVNSGGVSLLSLFLSFNIVFVFSWSVLRSRGCVGVSSVSTVRVSSLLILFVLYSSAAATCSVDDDDDESTPLARLRGFTAKCPGTSAFTSTVYDERHRRPRKGRNSNTTDRWYRGTTFFTGVARLSRA